MQNKKGTILEIQRMSTEDGPGIRTTVFLKGCTLKCTWCHNPESISPKPQIQWVEINCIGCKLCISECENNALADGSDKIIINRNLCTGCGACTMACPTTSMELFGKKWTVDDLVHELAKDKAFFETSKGGVTISGGEVTMQADFTLDLLKKLRKIGIKTAIDTCGQCKVETLEKLLPYVDILLFDLKEINSEKHKFFTGHSNKLILENLIFVSKYMETNSYPTIFWVRTPVIPDATATLENISGIGKFMSANLKRKPDRWELCTFNNLCKDKYIRLGLNWKHNDTKLLTKEEMENFIKTAKTTGLNPSTIFWSGSTQIKGD